MTNFYSNKSNGYSLLMIVENVGTPSIANNSSQVRARLYMRNEGYTFYGLTVTGEMQVDTQKFPYSGQPNLASANSSVLLLDKTVTVTHFDDGSKYIALNAYTNNVGATYAPPKLTISTNTFNLPTIQRASTVTVNDLDIGSIMTINIARQSSSFTHTIRYNWNGKTGTIGTSVGTQTTWTVPMDFLNDIPNRTYYWGTIYCDTYSGSTLIGTTTDVFNGYVPSNIKPTLSGITLTDTNTTASNILSVNNFVQIMSNPTVTFNGAVGAYGSTITNYKAEIVGKSQSTATNGGALGIMNWNGTATVRATVTDSRGRVSEPMSVSITVLEYSPPVMSFVATRAGVNNAQIVVTQNVKISPLIVGESQKNKMTLAYKTAPLNTTTYTIDTSNASKTYTSIAELINSGATLSGSFPANASFDVYGSVNDIFGKPTTFKQTIGTEVFPLTWDKTGIGVGKPRQFGALDVNGDIHATGKYYSGGKSIQHYQVTDDTGKISRLDNIDLNTVINDSKPIAIYATANTPIAGHGYYYLEVFQHTLGNSYVMQRATTRVYAGGLRVFERICENGVWGAWIELLTANSPSMINSGWVTLGNGFSYKRVGDLVSLYYDFTISNGTTSLTVGTLPANLVPRRQMFRIASWDNSVNNYAIQIQINTDGNIQWLNPSAFNKSYAGSVSWLI